MLDFTYKIKHPHCDDYLAHEVVQLGLGWSGVHDGVAVVELYNIRLSSKEPFNSF